MPRERGQSESGNNRRKRSPQVVEHPCVYSDTMHQTVEFTACTDCLQIAHTHTLCLFHCISRPISLHMHRVSHIESRNIVLVFLQEVCRNRFCMLVMEGRMCGGMREGGSGDEGGCMRAREGEGMYMQIESGMLLQMLLVSFPDTLSLAPPGRGCLGTRLACILHYLQYH